MCPLLRAEKKCGHGVLGRVLAGIVEQHVNHLGNGCRINRHRREHAWDLNPDVVLRRHGAGARHPGANQLLDINAEMRGRMRRVRTLGRRQSFDEAIQTVRLLVDDLEQLAAALGRQAGRAAAAGRAD